MTTFNRIFVLVRQYFLLFLDWFCQTFLGRRLIPLTEESLLKKFPPEDRRLLLSETLTRRWWYEGFTILLKCFREDETCTLAGRQVIETRWTEILRNRLAISKRLASVDLTKCPITKPIFIIGSARTGSTYLQALLNQDPRNTSPYYYEVMCPVIEGSTSKLGHEDLRTRTYERQLASVYRNLPSLKAAHNINLQGPYECFRLLDNTGIFKSYFVFTRNNSGYLDWVLARTKDEMAEMYQLHKKQLQLIFLSRDSDSTPENSRVILKDSLHSVYLEAILDAYPDAVFIHTYRDPVAVMASSCSVVEAFRESYGYGSTAIDRKALGKELLYFPWGHGGKEILKFRKDHPEEEHRFIDIAYAELVASPMDIVKRIYGHFGLNLTNHGRERMKRYVQENPQNKHGRHKYDLSKYGLTKDEVYEHFKEYIQYFNIQC
ncbi:uncharacterized protein LOC106179588 [Lingula anatina]|uniref:Uncharacterized protein LOC106179588 n=1 Tax=Lingula anatina TaxID=7574 RepID=A0A1S3K8I5_LINAN|nr:uncharacterized protein LOC106179588 [Lingula anatina]|eukprot:XP_013418754.1 uncharacterized protein LOC106179588 [Lingula anatina]